MRVTSVAGRTRMRRRVATCANARLRVDNTVIVVDLPERLFSSSARLAAARRIGDRPLAGESATIAESVRRRQESTATTTTTFHGEAARKDKARLHGLLHSPTIGHEFEDMSSSGQLRGFGSHRL